MPSFDAVVQHVVNEIRPDSVLVIAPEVDALVEFLRQQGRAAFGVRVPAEIGPNHFPDAGPYAQYDLPASLSQPYDLIIVCLEPGSLLLADELERAVETWCGHSDDVIFLWQISTQTPNTGSETHLLENIAECFAHHSIFRDLDFQIALLDFWIARFRKMDELSNEQVIVRYERRLWQLTQENQALQRQAEGQRQQLASQEQKLLAWETRWARLEGSMSWVVAEKLQAWRSRLSPPGSVREQALEDLFQALRTRQITTSGRAISRLVQEVTRQGRIILWKSWLRLKPPAASQMVQVEPVAIPPPLQPHQSAVDIIICVHNALPDLQRCLASVECHTSSPYSLILVDDGSDVATQTYLAEFVDLRQNAVLLRNDLAQGYTKAANRGLRHSSADYVVLLNSDTVVTAGWLDRLIACAGSNSHIGLVGPLSNTASWQSIPDVETEGDWTTNPLPPGLTIDDMGRLVVQYSMRLYPSMPFLNGFCLLVRRQLINELGLFDEENFGAGYGEENDYALRARRAGWRLALADDAYVYHAHSRSYSDGRRKQLSEKASYTLAKKHGSRLISQGISFARQDRVLNGIRARSRVMPAREEWIQQGQARFQGRRLLFVLPVIGPSGGINVIIDEALAMWAMGVEVEFFNLIGHQKAFERNYPALDLPLLYGHKEDLESLAGRYDGVVATANYSVAWLLPLSRQEQHPVLGYYVQDFEPYIYPPDSKAFQQALASYSIVPDLVCFTKTAWTGQEVRERTGITCHRIGISMNIDLLRPRPRPNETRPERPVKIVAMVRPRPAYRNAKLTMELLRQVSRHYRAGVEIIIFGVSLDDPEFADLPRDFAWSLAGILTQRQVAALLNEADIFADFSSHQAMGLTALEAMACGAAVIVPARGGAVEFARPEENSLVVDTGSAEACWQALQRLIEDEDLRTRLQRQALVDVCDYFPERPAFKILSTLFEPEDETS